MVTPDTQNEGATPNLPRVSADVDTASVTGAVHALLLTDAAIDAKDKALISAAAYFLRSPTGLLSDIVKHAENLGEVLAYREAMGEAALPDVDRLYEQLTMLQCRHHITTAQAALLSSDIPAGRHALALALDQAKHLAREFQKDDTLLREVERLMTEMGAS